MKGLGDAELMRKAAEGEDAAFGEIIERYRNVLLNFFGRKGVSYEDAQDLAQRTFLRLWRHRKGYTPTAKFTTFLFLLAGQEAVDFFRREDSRRNLQGGLEREAEVRGEVRGDGNPMRAHDVREAVARLPRAMRDVVELGVFQDLPYAEVGAALGIPLGTVKSRMFNALRKLKEMLS